MLQILGLFQGVLLHFLYGVLFRVTIGLHLVSVPNIEVTFLTQIVVRTLDAMEASAFDGAHPALVTEVPSIGT